MFVVCFIGPFWSISLKALKFKNKPLKHCQMLTSICFVLPQHFACCTGSTFQVQIKQNNLVQNLRRKNIEIGT